MSQTPRRTAALTDIIDPQNLYEEGSRPEEPTYASET